MNLVELSCGSQNIIVALYCGAARLTVNHMGEFVRRNSSCCHHILLIAVDSEKLVRRRLAEQFLRLVLH